MFTLPTHWIIIFSIVFLSGIIKGSTGFGFALFSFPLLVHFIPVKTLIPILTLFNLFSSGQIAYQTKQIKLTKRIVFLSIMGVLGVSIGSLLIKFIPDVGLEIVTAIVLIILSLLFLNGYRFKVRKYKRGFALAGFTSGLLGGSTSVSGPPLALFLTSTAASSANFRFTFAWFSIFTGIVAILDYYKIGIIHNNTFILFVQLLPLLIVSTFLGKTISNKLPQQQFFKMVIVLTLLSGLFLLYNSTLSLFH